jgi:basic membrane protein A
LQTKEQETALRHTMKVAAVMSVAALALAACGDSGDDPGTSGSSSSTSKKSDLKVGMAYDVGGRGDQSFNDSAAAGLDKAKTELGVDTKEAAAVNGENEAAR